ncbi:MAG: hypothetical protein JSS09_09555 [Verrucomicrobia bacterium]|nr:hypothetical protein [Verrucomicrobiota bacterium]
MDHFISTLTAILEEKLKESIQKEISLLRELLGNFLQEEMTLSRLDKSNWVRVMQERFTLTEEIKLIRNIRDQQAFQLKEPSCDILYLTEQLLALLQKIHEQTTRNENLLLNIQHLIAITNPLSYPERLVLAPAKKNTLMTLP